VSEIVALFLAGLGLFFTGVDGVRTKLQQLSSRRFRHLLTRLTDHPLLAALSGAAFGALTQSATAVAFILSGMVATGMIGLRRALPVVAAGNVGTAVLVFLAAVDLRLAILYLVGVTGLMISFKVAARHDALIGALFAIGLLFFGLDLMKRAVGPLPSYDWFHALVAFIAEWPLAPFVVGAACRMVIQSSSAIGVIAIALAHAGVFADRQAMLFICGAGPGAALSVYFLSATLQGAPRQVLLYQGIINALGGLTLAGLLAVDALVGHPLLPAWLSTVPGGFGNPLAWAYLATMGLALLSGLAAAADCRSAAVLALAAHGRAGSVAAALPARRSADRSGYRARPGREGAAAPVLDHRAGDRFGAQRGQRHARPAARHAGGGRKRPGDCDRQFPR